ncbi:MAG: hypothetical protein Q4G00_04015 [Clostridia bacterium]|nr:hypothetical protein [Clostridia bacterium]
MNTVGGEFIQRPLRQISALESMKRLSEPDDRSGRGFRSRLTEKVAKSGKWFTADFMEFILAFIELGMLISKQIVSKVIWKEHFDLFIGLLYIC